MSTLITTNQEVKKYQEKLVIRDRTPEMQAKYQEHLNNGGKDKFISYLDQELAKQEYILIENAYPYVLPEGWQHLVLWWRGANKNEAEVLQILSTMINFAAYHVEICINPIERKSILEYNHAQVFVKTIDI